ncbi:VWA domain-containing protein [Hazenella coriacea]|uniref:von Willebrand factor type A domain-containing protein n=1 Tax=Hazenella coriacea TaxID=1179467 RepID=A0A4R3LB30_9BACL|nr:VWA domain-containing protein [Hazenella coriacea]TCS96969.1 von Willebrand factor type A domain-containing protein [Hazenella coriacea]
MAISWSHPWFLILLLPLGWILWTWWKTEQRVDPFKKKMILIARGLIFLLIVSIIAQTKLVFPVLHPSTVFVVDRSASIQDPDGSIALMNEALKEKHPDESIAVISVGASPMVEQTLDPTIKVDPFLSVVNKHATDLAAGLRLAGGILPDHSRGRVVVLTDGQETQGSAEKEAKILKDRGIQVDVFSLASQSGPEVLIKELDVPKRLFVQEQADLQVQIQSNVETKGKLRLFENDRVLEEKQVEIHKGENRHSFTVQVKESGFLRYRVELEAEQDTISYNNQVFGFSQVEGAPKVLVVEGQPGEGKNLIHALQTTGVQVDLLSVQGLPETLDAYKQYASIVLVNTPAFYFPENKMELIRTAVQDLGVGLVATGGEEGYALGGWFKTPIEEALPVHSELKDKKRIPSLGLMIVVDKSGSMHGQKISLSKEAAIRATELLTPQDQIGVLAFDGENSWVVKPQHVENLNEIQGLIGSIPANGGTNIYPALQEGYQHLKKMNVKRKHMILLTDGQSHDGQYQALAEQMKKEGITLSTIAVGADADQNLLKSLSTWADGRYYFASNPSTIPTIFTKETSVATRGYIMDEPFTPKWTGGSDWYQQTKAVPPLRAYVATSPKQTAEVVMASPYPDPILARWQYGLGRTVAWTSDVNGKWSKPWVEWGNFPRFWNQVISWTFPQYETSGLTVTNQREGNTVHVTAEGNPEQFGSYDAIQLTLIDEKLQKKELVAKAISPGKFSTQFIADQPGTYLLQAKHKEKPLGTYGIAISYSPEYGLHSGTKEKLEGIAQQGGGILLSDLKDVFAQTPPSRWDDQDISIYLLLLLTLIWPIEIAIRRLSMNREDWLRVKAWINRFFQRAKPAKEESYSENLSQIQNRSRSAIQQRIQQKSSHKNVSVEALRVQKQEKGFSPKSNQKTTNETVKEKTSTSKNKPVEKKEASSTETHLSRLLAAKRKRDRFDSNHKG